jgi:antibiotic biosynthesis monooxygenase (ABM) superfamily enzyme
MKGRKDYVGFHEHPDDMSEISLHETTQSYNYSHYNDQHLDLFIPSSSLNPIIQIVYHTTVPTQQTEYFEKEWLPKMSNLYHNLRGFSYRSVNLLVQTTEVREYLVIIACRDYKSFLEWEATPLRSQMLHQLQVHQIVTRRLDTTSADQIGGSGSHPSKAFLKDTLGTLPPPLPPPKWKLCIIIYVGVIINIYLWAYTGIPTVMATAGLPSGFNLFVSLAISVPILSYAFFPLVMSIPIVCRWLCAPRPPNMSSVQKLLDQGLLMFAAKMAPGPSKETVIHFKKLECRLEATRRLQHHLTSEIDSLKEQLRVVRGSGGGVGVGVGGEGSNSDLVKTVEMKDTVRNKVAEGIRSRGSGVVIKSKPVPAFTDLESGLSSDQTEVVNVNDLGPLTVAVAHWVRWEHILDFELWSEDITVEMAK